MSTVDFGQVARHCVFSFSRSTTLTADVGKRGRLCTAGQERIEKLPARSPQFPASLKLPENIVFRKDRFLFSPLKYTCAISVITLSVGVLGLCRSNTYDYCNMKNSGGYIGL